MASKRAPVALAFSELRPLFGLAREDPKVLAVLERAGAKWQKPDGGDSYAVAKRAGLELLACRPKDAKRGAPLVVQTMFLYPEGDGRAAFADPPFGLAFSTRTELLARMSAPERSWKIGEGEVPLATADVDHDRWLLDGLHVSAEYREDKVRKLVVSLPDDPESPGKPPTRGRMCRC